MSIASAVTGSSLYAAIARNLSANQKKKPGSNPGICEFMIYEIGSNSLDLTNKAACLRVAGVKIFNVSMLGQDLFDHFIDVSIAD